MARPRPRSSLDVSVLRTPTPKQKFALACPAFELLYGGQKGGGKTEFLVFLIAYYVALAHGRWAETGRKQRRCRMVLFRKNLNDLKDISIRLLEVLPELDPQMGPEGWNKIEKTWSFTSGATLELRHLDGPDDHRGYHGQEMTLVMFDQVEDIAEDVYRFIFANVRTGDPFWKQHLRIVCTANPGGKQGRWVKNYFIDPNPAGNEVIVTKIKMLDGSEREVTRAFVPAGLRDNPHLGPEYEANLQQLPEHMRKMYLLGDWDAVEGAFFASMVRPELHYIKSFPIPASWEIVMGIDWGSANPACCLWAARDNDGNVYIIDELYDTRSPKTGRMFAEAMVKKFRYQQWYADAHKLHMEEPLGLIDSQATSDVGVGASPADGIRAYGFRIWNANKNRAIGIEQIRERLVIRPDGKPKLFIFRDRCPNLCRTLVTVEVDKKDPEDYDITGETHAVDAMRFILTNWKVETVRERDKKARETDKWLEMHRQRMEALEAAARADSYEMTTGYD